MTAPEDHPGPALPPFFKLAAFDSIDSTNLEALRRAREGAPEGTLIWAREQSRGHGRRNRAWASPPGNLYFTLLLRPGVPPAAAAQLGFAAAVALAETLAEILPPQRQIRCKWPNDVLVDGAKIAGILPEAEAVGATVAALVVGIGVNVASFPEGLHYRATSVAANGGTVTVEGLLERLAIAVARWYRRWQAEGFAPLRERWLDFAFGLGEPIEVRLETSVLHGRFAALDASGALDLALPDGGHRLVTAGDVFHPG